MRDVGLDRRPDLVLYLDGSSSSSAGVSSVSSYVGGSSASKTVSSCCAEASCGGPCTPAFCARSCQMLATSFGSISSTLFLLSS
jgi:hypothetical protein